MKYCQRCMHINAPDAKRCDECDYKKLTEPKSDSPVFLVTKNSLWEGVAANILKDNGIPYFTKRALGGGLSAIIGTQLELYRFYVPYAAFDKARDLMTIMQGGEDADYGDDFDLSEDIDSDMEDQV